MGGGIVIGFGQSRLFLSHPTTRQRRGPSTAVACFSHTTLSPKPDTLASGDLSDEYGNYQGSWVVKHAAHAIPYHHSCSSPPLSDLDDDDDDEQEELHFFFIHKQPLIISLT